MSEFAARNALPFLQVGQAQKEITHNEALVIVDALLQPTAQSAETTPPIGLGGAGCWFLLDSWCWRNRYVGRAGWSIGLLDLGRLEIC